MAEPTEDQVSAIAEALYRVDAPRYGNDIRPFDELGEWERRRFMLYARIAVAKWEQFKAP